MAIFNMVLIFLKNCHQHVSQTFGLLKPPLVLYAKIILSPKEDFQFTTHSKNTATLFRCLRSRKAVLFAF